MLNLIPYLGVGFSVIVTIFNIVIILAIKMNDLRHVQKSLDEIKEDLKCFRDKFVKLDRRVSRIEGKLNK